MVIFLFENDAIFANTLVSNSAVIGTAVVTLATSIPLSSSYKALNCKATSFNNSNLLFAKAIEIILLSLFEQKQKFRLKMKI